MKGTAIFLMLLIAVSVAVQAVPKNSAYMKKLDALIGQKKWASIILKLAELHLMAQGPVEALTDAIQDVVSDLGQKLDNANAEFDRRTNEHNSEVRRLTDLIREATSDIASTTEHINNQLIPLRDQLAQEIVDLNQRVVDNQNHIQTSTANRETSHNDYLTRVDEHNDALEGINEAFQLLETLRSQEDGFSLAQLTSQFKRQVKKIEGSMKSKTIDSTLIDALLEISSERFASGEGLQRVEELLGLIRNNLQTSLEEEHTTEDRNQSEFETDMTNTRQDIRDSLAQITEKTDQHANTEEQIDTSQQFIEERQADKYTLTHDLEDENDSFVRATQAFNELVTQFQAEQDACAQALDIIQNINLADYIQNRVNNPSGVIDQPHGQRFDLNN